MISEGAGKGESLANYIHAKTGLDVKAIVLGYIQRGGTPTADDRVLASRLGMRAVELLIEGKAGRVVGVRDNKVVDDDIGDALAMKPKFDNKLYDMSSTLSSIKININAKRQDALLSFIFRTREFLKFNLICY